MDRVCALIVCVGCSFRHGATVDARSEQASDTSIDAPGPFGAITQLALGSPGIDEDDPTLTEDLLEIYFDRGGDLYYSVRTNVGEAWPPANAVPNVNSGSYETTPELSPDGLELYYSSNQLGGFDIYVSTRANRAAAWSVGSVVTELSTGYDDYCPTMATSSVLYMSNTNPVVGVQDLWRSTRTSTTWSAPELVAGLSSPGLETEPFVTANETTVYLVKDTNLRDIYAATRATSSDAWGAAMPVSELNTSSGESDPWLSPDGRTMVFSSDRAGGSRIYMATR